jgi:hypothetical protein
MAICTHTQTQTKHTHTCCLCRSLAHTYVSIHILLPLRKILETLSQNIHEIVRGRGGVVMDVIVNAVVFYGNLMKLLNELLMANKSDTSAATTNSLVILTPINTKEIGLLIDFVKKLNQDSSFDGVVE